MAKQKKLQKEPTNVAGSIVILLGSFIMIFPFIWMILSAFKTPGDVYAYPPKWLPSQWNLDNFKKVFEMIPFWTYYGNSIFTAVVETFLQIGMSILAAYALTKLRFPGRNFIYSFLQRPNQSFLLISSTFSLCLLTNTGVSPCGPAWPGVAPPLRIC